MKAQLYDRYYSQFYGEKYMEYENEAYKELYQAPGEDQIDARAAELEADYKAKNPEIKDLTETKKKELREQAQKELTDAAQKKARTEAAAKADEAMKDEPMLEEIRQKAQEAADQAFGDGVLTVGVKDDSYYRMTAANFDVLAAMLSDPNRMANRYSQGDGVEQNDLLEDLKILATDKRKMSFRGCSASEFLQCILSDVALNAQRANTFSQSFRDISGSINVKRTSISGVDEDEEAVSLVKYQNGYNLASKMIQTLTEIYDKLILETGV